MPPFFSNKKLIILMTSLILLVALIGFSLQDRKQQSWPEQFIHDTVGWFQYIFNKPAQYVAGFFENVGNIKDVYQENKLLKAHLQDYAQLRAKYDSLSNRYENLQKELNIDQLPELVDSKRHTALVIGHSFDDWNQKLTVNKGEQQGIKQGMAVMTPEGLIGKVTAVNQFTSVVTLISDQMNNNQIAATVLSEEPVEEKDNNDSKDKDESDKSKDKQVETNKTKITPIFGMIEGYDPEKNVLLFKKLPIDATIDKGDQVVTSGLSEVYPRDLLIGTVVDVHTDQYQLTKVAEVRPAANFDNIFSVDIIERLAPVSPNKGESE